MSKTTDNVKEKRKSRRFVMLAKRTNDPKLGWLERELAGIGIDSKRTGYSFHAPILSVRECDYEAAWAILGPVDDVDDDDPRFQAGDWRGL